MRRKFHVRFGGRGELQGSSLPQREDVKGLSVLLRLPARQVTWAVLLYSEDRPDHSHRLLLLRRYGLTTTVAEPLGV